MKIKVSCRQHGNTMDGSGVPFFVPVEGSSPAESLWEVDLSDLWCSHAKYKPTTSEYVHCELKMEITES